MKKVILTIAAAATLVGCGAASTSIPDATSAPITVPPAVKEEYGADNYINNIASEYPHLINNLGRRWLIDYANTTCEEIDNGMTLNDLAQMAVQNNIDAGMIGFLTGEAIRNFCPRNQWFIDAGANA